MSTAGWIVMVLSVGVVTVSFIWCVIKVLSANDRQYHSPADIHPDEYDHQAPSPRPDNER